MKTNNSEVLTRIQKETLNLITTYGVKGWTMDTVCKQSGLAKDTLYRIIGNKEDLIKRVLVQVLDEHNQKMADLLNQDKDFFITLREITAVLSSFLAKFSLDRFNQVILEYPSVEKTINDNMEVFFANFEIFLDDGKKAGYLKENVDPKLFINIIHTCIMQILKQPEKFNAAQDITIFLDYMIDGVRV